MGYPYKECEQYDCVCQNCDVYEGIGVEPDCIKCGSNAMFCRNDCKHWQPCPHCNGTGHIDDCTECPALNKHQMRIESIMDGER